MKEKYVVLRGTRAPANRGRASPAANAAFAASEISVDTVDHRDAMALAADAEVVAIAPAMPMRLIEPREVRDLAPGSAGTVAWGVQAVKADTSAFSGNGIVAAILDTGIDATHPAFTGMELLQKDFTGEGDGDAHGHGTHCAGTVFGRPVNGTRIGVAPGIRRALIGKVLGEKGGSSEQIVQGVQWAVDNGAHIISMSLGMDFPGFVKQLIDAGFPPELATSRALEGYRANVQLFERLASLIRARAQPSLIVAAAGNESRRDVDPRFEIAVGPPAVAEGFVSVVALGQGTAGFLKVAGFSNTGADVAAPGVAIASAKAGGGLVSMSGTSMAAPHVAGVAALWAERIQKSGPLEITQLTSRLIASAGFQQVAAGFDPVDVGAGLVTAPQD
jgi:subtilisin family serine protease